MTSPPSLLRLPLRYFALPALRFDSVSKVGVRCTNVLATNSATGPSSLDQFLTGSIPNREKRTASAYRHLRAFRRSRFSESFVLKKVQYVGSTSGEPLPSSRRRARRDVAARRGSAQSRSYAAAKRRPASRGQCRALRHQPGADRRSARAVLCQRHTIRKVA